MPTKHFFVYHNPDKMPYNVTKMDTLEAFSNKIKVKPFVLNKRIWVVGGVGKPRSYYLGGTFICNTLKRGRYGFKFGMRGENGCLFDSKAKIYRKEPWFRELRHITGNFRSGLTEVKDTIIIKGLVSAAKRTHSWV